MNWLSAMNWVQLHQLSGKMLVRAKDDDDDDSYDTDGVGDDDDGVDVDDDGVDDDALVG